MILYTARQVLLNVSLTPRLEDGCLENKAQLTTFRTFFAHTPVTACSFNVQPRTFVPNTAFHLSHGQRARPCVVPWG